MFENVLQTRAAITGTGLLLGIIFLLAHLPVILLAIPVAVLFLGIVADPEETHAVWYGMLSAIGIFAIAALTEPERALLAQKRHYFWFGEVGLAALLAGTIAVPAGIWFAARTDPMLAFIGAAILFLPLFVFLPRLVRSAMNADTDAALESFGRNEQVRKISWALFVAVAGLVLARIVDPSAARQILGLLTGT